MNNKLSKLFIVILTTLLFVVNTPTSCIFADDGSGSIEVTAIVTHERKINVLEPKNGKVIVVAPEKIYKGDKISFKVVPDEGYELKSLVYYTDDSSKSIDITSTMKLIMPDEDITVIATFKTKDKKPSPTPDYVIPNTGIVGLLTSNDTSSNIFKLVLVVITACVVIVLGSKNNKK